MSNKDLNRSIKIYIDGTEAAQGVGKVETAIQKLETELASLNKSESNYATRSRQLQKEINSKNKTLQAYKAKVEETDRVLKNLSGATYNQLLSVQAQVRKDLRSSIPGTQKHTAALEQNRRVTEALTRAQAAMRVEVGCQGTTMGKAVGFFNQYAAVVTTGIAAITGATMALNNLRTKRNQREEAKADVEALTGLDKESISWLEQQAVQLSTTMQQSGIRIRQSATEILDAYKLVGSAKPELLENKEALAEVTKQTLILASASGMSLKDAVNAVTLSLNQYGDGADQAARYTNVMAAGSKYGAAAVESVTSAITKSGVAAASADIPIEQLVGTIETLAEKGIKDEIAGTGLKKFFLTLQTGADDTNPKIVGLETALDNLQKKQLSATQIKKMFGEEGYNVASVLINEADKVKYYTEAVTGTSVAMEQAATKSDTAAAKLDQAKNKMHEMGIELMDKLNPALVSAANGAVNWSSRLVTLISWINKHKTIVLTTTTAIAAYYTGVKLATLWETRFKDAKLATVAADTLRLQKTKLLTASQYAAMGVQSLFAKGMGTLSTRVLFSKDCFAMLFRTLKLNPFGIIATIVATVAIGIYKLATRTNEASKATQDFIKKNIEEQRELRKTYTALENTRSGSQARLDLIDEFNRKYGGYLTNLLSEKSTIDDLKTAYQEASIAIQQKMAAQVLNEKTDEIERKSLDSKTEKLQALQETLSKGLTNNQLQKALPNIISYVDKYIQQGKSVEEITKGVASGISNTYQQFRLKQDNGKFGLDLIPKIVGQVKDYVKVVKQSATEVQEVKNKLNPFLKQEKAKPANVLDEIVITPEKRKPSGVGTPLTPEEMKKRIKSELDAEKSIYEQKQATLKEMYLEGHDETLQTEKQFNSELECLQLEHLQRSIKIVGEKSREAAQYQNQINDIKIKQQTDNDKKYITELEQSRSKELDQQKSSYNSTLNSYKWMLSEKKLSQKEYEILTASLSLQNSENILSIEQKYYAQSKQLQLTSNELKESVVNSSTKRVELAEQQSLDVRLSTEKKYYDNLDAMRKMAQQAELSPEEKLKTEYELKTVLLQSIYQASIDYARKNGQDENEVEQAYLAAKKALYEKYCSDKVSLTSETQQKMSEIMGDELSHEVATIYDAVSDLRLVFENFSDDKFWDNFKGRIIDNMRTIAGSVSKSLSSAFSTFQQIELNNLEARYNAEIEAAQGNSTEIERLEKEKAQKKLDVEKKYADVQFAIKASEIIANTALAVMQAYGQLGPIAGSIAAAMLVATGAIQLAAANSERNKVKSMTLSGASTGDTAKTASVTVNQWGTGRYDVIGQDDNRTYHDVPYIGPAPTGIVRRTSLVSETGAELIINAEDLNRLQRHINYPLVVQAINDARSGHVPQRADGNYDPLETYTQNINAITQASVSSSELQELCNAIGQLIAKLGTLKAYVVLRDLHEAEELDRRARETFTKKTK